MKRFSSIRKSFNIFQTWNKTSMFGDDLGKETVFHVKKFVSLDISSENKSKEINSIKNEKSNKKKGGMTFVGGVCGGVFLKILYDRLVNKSVKICQTNTNGHNIIIMPEAENDAENGNIHLKFVQPDLSKVNDMRIRSRYHTDSEGSSESEFNRDKDKRQRTMQSITPGVASSPPKLVSVEEFMKAAKDLQDMSLVHEIVIDSNFKLEKNKPAQNSVEARVKSTMHKAFWDLLTEELNENPPSYDHAMVLLEEIKENLHSLLLPQHTKIKQEINEILDIPLIRLQAEIQVLDFQHYAQYIISVMGKLCAPGRDEEIRKLTQTTDIVPLYRGILETLKLMKLDMANFTIRVMRPELVAKSIEFEKAKFAEFLKVQPGGLELTRQWLSKHIAAVKEETPSQSSSDNTTLVRSYLKKVLPLAFLELLQWNADTPFPETVIMDGTRFMDLNARCLRMTVTGTALLVTISCVPQVQGNEDFKRQLKEHVTILVADVASNADVEKLLPSILIQVVKDVEDVLAPAQLTPEVKTQLEGQILDIFNADNKIRQLLWSRIKEFLHQSITSKTAAPQQVPPGLSSLQAELTAVTGQLLRLFSHNVAVFSDYYTEIVNSQLS